MAMPGHCVGWHPEEVLSQQVGHAIKLLQGHLVALAVTATHVQWFAAEITPPVFYLLTKLAGSQVIQTLSCDGGHYLEGGKCLACTGMQTGNIIKPGLPLCISSSTTSGLQGQVPANHSLRLVWHPVSLVGAWIAWSACLKLAKGFQAHLKLLRAPAAPKLLSAYCSAMH